MSKYIKEHFCGESSGHLSVLSGTEKLRLQRSPFFGDKPFFGEK